jgi:HK97 family phage major capsid protein
MLSLNDHRGAWLHRLAGIQAVLSSIGIRADGRTAEELQEDLDALRTQQNRLITRSQALLDEADADGRELTDEERRGIQRRTHEVERLEVQAQAIEVQLSRPQPRRTVAGAGEPLNQGGESRIRTSNLGSPGRHVFNASVPRRYAEMFGAAAARDTRGAQFASFGDFARAVAAGNDQRLMIRASYSGNTTGEGASAGFMVPTHFAQQLLDMALLQEVVRPRANVVPINSGSAIIAGFDGTDRSGGKRAGLQMLWGAEAAQLVQQKAKARRMGVDAKKANVFCVVSSELMDDAPNFDQALSQAMVAAVVAGLDYAFIAGTGAGMPLGMLDAPATIEVPKEGGQAANTLLLQNLAKMVGRLDPASFVRSVWFVHPTVVPLLYLLSYTVKNVAGSENVGGSHVQAVTHDADGNLRIFGRPALVTDACSPLSNRGDIMLADPMRYMVALRNDMRLVRDTSQFFDTDEIAFRLTLRLDGMPEDPQPIKLRYGTNTVSPFVVLQAR